MVFSLAIRIVRLQIAANRWRFESLRTARARDSRHLSSDGVRVRFRVRFQAVKVPIFGGFPVENPTTIRHENTTYPKKYFRIIFRLPFHDFDFFELILDNYPIPIAFV